MLHSIENPIEIMKKLLFLLPLFVVAMLSIMQCDKVTDMDIAPDNNYSGITALVRGNTTLQTEGSVLIWFNEYFDDDRPLCGADYAASFYSNGSKTFAGTMAINGIQLSFLSDNHYYRSMSSSQDGAILCSQYGSTVSVSLSGNTSFPSLSNSIYVPKKLNVKSSSNIGSVVTDMISKSSNLNLNWDADIQTPGSKLYILIVADAPGSVPNAPAIVIETEDDGAFTINSSSFQNFQVGGTATIHCGRGRSFVTDVGGKQIEITSVVEAKSGVVEIVQ